MTVPTVPTPCRAVLGTVSVDRAVCLKAPVTHWTVHAERPTDLTVPVGTVKDKPVMW